MPLPIVYEDPDVVVINKPVGLASVSVSRGKLQSVTDFLRPGEALAHRLDNDTSGCLIIARTPAAHSALRRQFENASIYKEYLAVVLGPAPSHGHCDLPIIHAPKSARRMHCAPSGESGQPAHTEWEVIRHYPPSPIGPIGYAQLRIRISTGVRHQIRLHLSHLGHPLVGDRLYQSRSLRDCDGLGIPHHLLHASRISFISPATKQHITCVAPLSTPFQQALKTLDEYPKRR